MFEKLAVQPLRVELPFRLNHVQCFVGFGDDGVKIMDAGLHNDTAEQLWRPIIEKHKVSDIIVTHYHPDHYGYAGKLQELTGAAVHMTEIDEQAANRSWAKAHMGNLLKNYKRCAIPDALAEEMQQNTVDFIPLVTPAPTIGRHLKEGEKISFGKYEYEIIFTPGHSDGLITLYNQEESILFSTDHILPKITPNISYWFHGDPNPLQTYFTSLEKIRKRDVEHVIPSHGKPFTNANKRIAEIISHHNERLDTLLSILKEPNAIYPICMQLFGKQLTVHEMRFAIGETIAHLEYLVYQGECEKVLEAEKWIYERK